MPKIEHKREISKYVPSEIEKKWQKKWEEAGLYEALDFDKKPKFYVLIEFPYPSGSGLHVGHVRSWSAMDAYSRKKRMEGKNVLYPIGWDAFGLPAENYALKMHVHPSTIVPKNIAKFKKQCKSLGLSFDWSREINTTDPKYYKWTQWIFLKFFEKGLAYRADVPVNWCPSCKTNLADEEVLPDGTHERCGATTEKRMQKQWLLKITKYADRLLEDLSLVDYSQKIATQQVNWIGRSEGAQIEFKIQNSKFIIEVFTTRPDTLYGATFMVLAPEHPIAKQTAEKNKEINEYIKKAQNKTEQERIAEGKEKTGVDTGLIAVNPVNNEEIPIWIADYVVTSYGTGAIMAVPAHDQRDFEFAKKYDLPIVQTIAKEKAPIRSYLMGGEDILDSDLKKLGIKILEITKEAYRKLEIPENKIKDYEKLIIDKMTPGFWNEYIARDIVFIFKFKDGKIKRFILDKNNEEEIDRLGEEFNGRIWRKKSSVWKWLAKNDTYTDLIVHSDSGTIVNSGEWNGLNVPEEISKTIDWLEKKGLGKREIHYHLRDWVFSRQHYWGEPIPIIHCKKCGPVGVSEKELPVKLPYLEKYEPSGTGESPLSQAKNWLKAKCPKCGKIGRRETDTMPNWAGSNWYFLRYLDPQNDKAIANIKKMEYFMPVDIYQGGFEHTTLHLLYSRFVYKFLYDIGIAPTKEPYAKRRSHGIVLGPDNRKMSKSFDNIINPDDIINKFGADTLRIYEMFMGPFDQTIAWSEESLQGCFRFLKRVWQLFLTKVSDKNTSVKLVYKLHKTIKKVSEDLENLKFNTAVASLMEFIKDWRSDKEDLNRDDLKKFLLILAPFAPHMTEEIWQKLQNSKLQESIHIQSWPKFNTAAIVEKEVTIIAQINGKIRDTLRASREESENQQLIEKIAKESQKIKKYLSSGTIKKVVYVKDKVINFVVV